MKGGARLKCPSSMNNTQAQMDRVEINRSIMELNFKKEELQRQIDQFQAHINHLVAMRDMIQFQETPLFDEIFGG
jgi:hypothetical protein